MGRPPVGQPFPCINLCLRGGTPGAGKRAISASGAPRVQGRAGALLDLRAGPGAGYMLDDGHGAWRARGQVCHVRSAFRQEM